MIEPAIVVIAYNREKPLSRLLESLAIAHYPSQKITLHISIDSSENIDVEEVARAFEWKHGDKVVDVKSEHLGLLKHVFECGQLTEKYDAVIVLEDDLIVAPGYYFYAQKANEFYSEDERVAGVSLYTYGCEENNFYPFYPVNDGSDVHFIQVASSWGQAWNTRQWKSFKEWVKNNLDGKTELLPAYVDQWGMNSWKRLFIGYLIDTDRYFVFPATSYSSNFEEKGTHAADTGLFQVPLNLGTSEPRFRLWKDSLAVYDAYFELEARCLKQLSPDLSEFDFQVDIYGEKPIEVIDTEYVLTSRRGMKPVRSFGARMKPLIQNVIFNDTGAALGLYKRENLQLTENKRFLALESSSLRQDQLSEIRTQTQEQVTVVMPVLDDQMDKLNTTIHSLKTDRFYNASLLIVCSPSLEMKVESLKKNAALSIEIVRCQANNSNELLQTGFENCKTDYCGWAQPGMILNPDRLEQIAQVFREIRHVQILNGAAKQVIDKNSSTLNMANARWTPQIANADKEGVIKVRTEFVFWRMSLFSSNELEELTIANLFLELLKKNPVYALALNLGGINGINPLSVLTINDVKNSLWAAHFQPKGGARVIVRPIFQYWFRRNVPFFRLFYRDMERLPVVIRHDFVNNSFYLVNY